MSLVIIYKKFQGNESQSIPVDLTSGCTNPLAINYNPLATSDDGSCVLPSSSLDAGDVLVILLKGHSQIAGHAANLTPGIPVGNFPEESSKVDNDVKISIYGDVFRDYAPLGVAGIHGREMEILPVWKNYFDSSNGEKLHITKSLVVGAASHSQYMIGGKYFQRIWSELLPQLNSLISSGKKIIPMFIFDMWIDTQIFGSTALKYTDVEHSHWCVARAFGLHKINLSLTTNSNDNNQFGFMNSYFENYVLQDTEHRHVADGRGLVTTDGVHWSHSAFVNLVSQHLPALAAMPIMKIDWNLKPIDGVTVGFKILSNAIATNFNASWDAPCECRVYTDEEKLYSLDVTTFDLDIRTFKQGFLTLVNNSPLVSFILHGGVAGEFDLVEKYVGTLKNLDIRENALRAGNSSSLIVYSNDYILDLFVKEGVSGVTLNISNSINPLTSYSTQNILDFAENGNTLIQ